MHCNLRQVWHEIEGGLATQPVAAVHSCYQSEAQCSEGMKYEVGKDMVERGPKTRRRGKGMGAMEEEKKTLK